MSRSCIRVNGNRRSVVIASAVLALCMVGGLGHAHGLELTNAVLYPEARMLTATFDADVDPDSVDASKFYIREAGFATGGIQLAGSAAFANGAVVSLFLTDAHVAAQERIYSKRLAIETGAVASAAGEQFDAAFGIGTAFFAGAVSVQAVDAGSDGLGFSRDGTKMFVGDYNNHIREYALGTAFDVSTARLVGNSPRLDDSTGHFAFSPDGSRLFVSLDGSQIRQYDTAAPFDTSNLTDAGSLSVGSEYSLLYGIALSADGRNVFVADGDDGQIRQYGLPSPFDLAGASYAAALDLAPQEITPTSFAFGKDGTRMLILDDKDAVFEYALPNAFNLTGAVYGGTFIDLGSAENDNTANALGLAFDNDGRKMFVVNSPDHFAVSEYVLGTFGMEVLDETASTIRATANPDAAFVTTWQTTSANEEIMIPTGGMGGSYTVTWGDASISTHVSGDQTHVYKEPGTYIVSIYGDFTRIYLPYHPENSLKLLSIEQWGDIRWESMRGAFNGATNMVYRATDTPNLSAVTDTSEMLRFALRFNGNLSNWDVSSVTDMSDMFSIAGAFNGDISTWNVSSVTDMSNMFLATNSFDQNLGNWYVVLHDTSISGANEKLAISAQNAYLDGQNPTYAVDDPLFVVTGGALSIKPGLSVPPGSYEVTVTSTGGFGQGNSKKVEISVGAAQANSPPSVDAGEPVAVREGVQVTLNATASDQDGDQLTYSWRHDSSLEMILTDADSLVPSFTAPQVHGNTTIAFTLTADDGMENGTDTVQVTVLDEPANSPPSVDAGEPVAVREGVQVTLNATASDQDGDQLTYSWRHDSSLEMILTDADSLVPSFTAPQVHGNTTIAFTLTADDGMENGTDTVQVTVLDEPANSPPSVDAGEPVAVREGVQVTLNATASDQDGDQLTYSWRHDSSLEMILTDADSLAPSFTAPQVHGNTTIAFTLTADDGMENGTDTVQVTVLDEPANSPPSVDAGEPVAVREGVQVTLNATASDQDGDQLTYSWRHDSSLEMILTDADSLAPSFTAPQVHGNTTIAFTLTADDGMENGTDTVQVTVLDEPANSPPSVDAGEPVAVREGVQVTLNATASDQDGDQLTYSWRHDSSLEMILTDADSLAPSFTAPQVHGNTTIAFTLTADDGMENGTDTVQVTVLDEPANSPPSVDAGEPVAVREGVQVTLNATASDQDGDQLTYSWRHDSSLEMILTDADSLAPSFTAPQVHGNTTIAFTLTADDGMENGTDTVQVTVLDEPANSPPSVDAGEPVAVREGVQVTLNATASDQDGDQLTYSWRHDSSLEMILTDADSLAPSFTAPQVHGNTTIAFTLTADDGMENGTDTVQVTILDVPAVGTPNGGSGQNTTVVLNPDEPLGPRDIGRIILTRTTPGTIEASWVAPSEAPANYRISWAKVGDPYLTWSDSTGNAFPTDPAHTITGLEEGEAYKVKVRASYSGTSGDWSGDVTITIAEVVTNTIAEVVTNTIAVPGTPVNIGVSPGSSGTLDISWQAPAFDGGSSITGYTIQWKAASGDWTVPSDVSEAATTGTSHTITGLTEGTTYAVRVFATNSIGDGVPSAESMVTQQTPQQPLGPRDIGRITLTSTTPGTIDASWVAPSEAPANYRISWAKVGDPYLTWTDSAGNAFPTDPSHAITGLEGGETYNVKVRASYSGTSGDWSDGVTATTTKTLHPFITTWQTTAAGESITIPVGGATGIYTIDWGDGNVNYDVSGDQGHTYDDAGTYTVRISGDFARIYLNGQQPNADKLQSIEQWGDVRWESMRSAFQGASSMEYHATDIPDLSGVTAMRYMFEGAASFNGDLSDWDVSSVTDMSHMFRNAASFNGDISDWDVSSVTDMSHMFRNAASFNGDISDWDVSSVTDMRGLFYDAGSFNGDISDWDVSSVTDMSHMFRNAASFNGDISDWDVSSVTDMRGLFYDAGSFNGDISDWDVSSVTDMSHMFRNAASFNANLSDWDVSLVTNMAAMFEYAGVFNGDISAWDVSSVTDTSYMFDGAVSFNQPINSWNVSAVTDMAFMLIDAESFAQNLGDWYIMLDDTSISSANETLPISAQNAYLDGQNPTYAVDDPRFVVTGGALSIKSGLSVPPGSYEVNVTSTGDFGQGNSKKVEISVDIAQANSLPSVDAGEPVAVREGAQVTLNATASDQDGDQLTYSWNHDSTLDISMANADSLSPTFTAPQVSANTTVAFMLTADDGTDTHSDAVTVTILDVPAVSTVVTDTTAPTISSIERSNPSSATTESRTLVYRITFSEDVTGVGTADFALSSDSTGETNGNNPVTSISGSGDKYHATVSATTDGTYNLDLVSSGHGIADAASNRLANTTPTGADETYTVSTVVTDTTAPTISSIERSNPSSATTESRTLVYRITFSEDVTGVGTADFALSSDSTGETNGNNPVTSISGSGDTYYATVSASTDGTYNLDLVSSGHGIADESSNRLANTTPTGADETYTVSTTVIDTTANPRLESIERYHPTSQNTNAQYPIYKATFSKSVTGVGASDFVLSPDSTGGGKNGSSPIAGISGSGDTYYVIISPAVDGTYNLDLVSSGHNIADAASNPLTNTTPTGADATYTVSR